MNRAEHQRSLLATMGIDLWIPRADVCVKNYITQNYRDVVEQAVEPVTFVVQPNTTTHLDKNLSQEIISSKSVVKPQLKTKDISVEIEPSLIHDSDNTYVQINTAQVELKVEAFDLQLYAMELCVLVLNTTQLTAEQRQLWRNIQLAKKGIEATLHWPFPFINIQDGRGVESYIQGFIDVYAQEKKLICLGEIPHLSTKKYDVLASLQQMIDQPILKKELWNVMQGIK